jgi:hypothetical protein
LNARHPKLEAMPKDWSTFDGFRRPLEQRSWAGVVAWTSMIEAQLGADRSALAEQRDSSDQLLHDLDGDPSARDWTLFLPLRREREEDWSDWLAQLIADSTTGLFAWALLGAIEVQRIDSYIGPVVHREVLCEGYRADLVIEWIDASYTHIEVKVGDQDLGKTFGTAQNTAKRFGRDRTCRSDAVLLLPSQRDAWDLECNRQPELGERVSRLTWLDVARALRSALPHGAGESIHWRVWAHVFCGAVEQDLLGMRSGRKAREWARSLTFQGLDTAAKLFTPNGDD